MVQPKDFSPKICLTKDLIPTSLFGHEFFFIIMQSDRSLVDGIQMQQIGSLSDSYKEANLSYKEWVHIKMKPLFYTKSSLFISPI